MHGPADKFGQRQLMWETQSHTKKLPGIAADNFQTWLKSQGETASEHIAAWFNARCTTPAQIAAPEVPQPAPATETKVERQDRRLKMCIDAGLKMPTSAVGRLPDGVGRLAEEEEGVTRQAFTDDVKEALARELERNRPRPVLVADRGQKSA